MANNTPHTSYEVHVQRKKAGTNPPEYEDVQRTNIQGRKNVREFLATEYNRPKLTEDAISRAIRDKRPMNFSGLKVNVSHGETFTTGRTINQLKQLGIEYDYQADEDAPNTQPAITIKDPNTKQYLTFETHADVWDHLESNEYITENQVLRNAKSNHVPFTIPTKD